MSTRFLAAIVLALLPALVSASGSTLVTAEIIALSPDVAVGIVLGLFFIGMLVFALYMVMDIQTSDKIGQPREVAPGASAQSAH